MKITQHAAEVTLITPTGHRPEAFALCERWMARQTFQGTAQWIVVSDEIPLQPQQCTMEQLFVGRTPNDTEQQHTLPLNLLSAIPHIKSPKVLIIEDDDWYAPEYVETMLQWLQDADLVGEVGARYYHLVHGFLHFRKHTHASLCRTGFNAPVMNTFLASIHDCIEAGTPSVDMKLWNDWQGSKKGVRRRRGSESMCIGIKGMPGRTSSLHGPRAGYTADRQFTMLRNWVGEDWPTYAAIIDAQTSHQIPEPKKGC